MGEKRFIDLEVNPRGRALMVLYWALMDLIPQGISWGAGQMYGETDRAFIYLDGITLEELRKSWGFIPDDPGDTGGAPLDGPVEPDNGA